MKMNKVYNADKLNYRYKWLCMTVDEIAYKYNRFRNKPRHLFKFQIRQILDGNKLPSQKEMFAILWILQYSEDEAIKMLEEIYK